ncbi:hypothetical protein [Streptomyces sp. SID8352]|nr:hypothetical protein [Streptomyces sp. SID8352]
MTVTARGAPAAGAALAVAFTARDGDAAGAQERERQALLLP